MRASRGFSLLEVLIALVVFAIGALALGAFVPLGGHGGHADARSRASLLAAERAERLLAMPYRDDQLAAGTHADASNPVEGRYYVTWTVADDRPIASCKRVLVQVSRDGPGRRAEAAVTIVCPRSGG